VEIESGKYEISNKDTNVVVIGDNSTTTIIHNQPPNKLPTAVPYTNIKSDPPPTKDTLIQQRTTTVKEILTQLIQPDLNALILTGIAGSGKSTLAALVYDALIHEHPLFEETPLWLRIDATNTLTDLIGTLFEELQEPLPNLSNRSPANLAQLLCHTLSMMPSRLVVLDQFENFLEWETSTVRSERPGIGEWLDALNSQPFQRGCRLLLTCRSRPKRDHQWPFTKEYAVKGLAATEGAQLLENLNVQAIESDLREAVQRCDGHAQSLTILASVIETHKITLRAVLRDATFSSMWKGDVKGKMLEEIYKQLSDLQRQILLAFSVYRAPIHLDAMRAIILDAPEVQIRSDINLLLNQHLLQASGEGKYQLHSVIAFSIQQYFDDNYPGGTQEAHAKAAHYYQQQALELCPSRDTRRSINDIQPLIEATWQLCQAEQWAQAYNLIEQEGLFISLKRFGGNAILLELFQLLIPFEKWQPNDAQKARIYNYLGDVYRTLGQMEQAQNSLIEALKLCDQAQTTKRSELPFNWILNNLGRLYSASNQWELAQDYFERALTICRENSSDSSDRQIESLKDEITTLNDLAKTYRANKKKKLATDYCKQALLLSQRVQDHGKEATTLKNLGDIYSSYKATTHKERARKYYEEALSIQRKEGIYGEEGLTLSSLGLLCYELGEKKQAQEYFKKALIIRRKVGDPLSEATLLYYIGTLSFEYEEYDISLACFLRAEAIFNAEKLFKKKAEYALTQQHIQELKPKFNQEQFQNLERDANQLIERALLAI
jgi:tetratricopeptide (TPR) repeat protein